MDNLSLALKQTFLAGSLAVPMVLALVAGLLTSLSPCVYPLIPITLSVIGAKRYDGRLSGFFTASIYVLGMSLVYASLGAIFASLGWLAGSIMSNPVVLTMIALVFMAFSLSMFGAFHLLVPDFLLKRLIKVGGQGYRGTFLMGMVAGLIAAPCTGPVLGFILTLIAGDQNIGSGMILMASFSLGMGLPFLALGTFSTAIARLPKSGPWMNSIKWLLGAIMLGVAIYYLGLAYLGLNRALLILASGGFYLVLTQIFLGAILLMAPAHLIIYRSLVIIRRGAGAIMLAVGLAALLNAEGLNLNDSLSTEAEIGWHLINAHSDKDAFDKLLSEARLQAKKVLVDFYADWCVACRQLSNTTFSDISVKNAMKSYFLIKVDSSTTTSWLSDLQSRFSVSGLPTIILIDELGRVRPELTILGYVNPGQLLERLEF